MSMPDLQTLVDEHNAGTCQQPTAYGISKLGICPLCPQDGARLKVDVRVLEAARNFLTVWDEAVSTKSEWASVVEELRTVMRKEGKP